MQRKSTLVLIGLLFITLAFGSNISYSYARQTCYSLTLVVDSGAGLPPIATAPNCGNGQYGEGTIVELTAQPDPGFTVTAWRGTNDDTSASLSNTVTMTSDKIVGVSYSPAGTQGHVSADVTAAVTSAGSARVIVTLRDPVSITSTGEARQAAVAQVQAAVLADLLPGGFQLNHLYSHIPALAGTVDAEALAALQQNPLVASVEMDMIVYATTDVSVPAINADDVHAMGITGDGVTVAVLDTGIDTNHPDLQDDIVAQRCFNQLDCPPNNTNQSANAEDENGHGTNVSGIITANGTVAPIGFAPDAKIVAIRVLNTQGSGSFSDILAGLNWIISNQATLSVDVINMSLGADVFPGNCDTALPSLTNAMQQLHNLGIVIFAASGNDADSTGVSIPACVSNVIAVGAVYDSNMGREPDYPYIYSSGCFDATTAFGKITCFSNSGTQLDVLAPGARITSAGVGGGTVTYFGTSQASPTAAGVAALMLESNPSLTPAQLEARMENTGILTTDTRNGLKFPRIDALRAVGDLSVPTLTLPANGSATADTTPPFKWQAVSGATQYQLHVDNNSNFASPVINVTRTTTTYMPTTPLGQGVFYWRVRARLSSGTWGSWSTRWSFTVDTVPPGRPVLTSPANNATIGDTTPLLQWQTAAGATRYQYQLDNNSDFSSPIFTRGVTTTSATVSPALANGLYYWRVRALDKAGNVSAWSLHRSFRVMAGATSPSAGVPDNGLLAPTEVLNPKQGPNTISATGEPNNTPTPTDEPTATPTATEVVGSALQRVESDQTAVQQTGTWTSHLTDVASGGSYLFSSGSFDDALTLVFSGTQAEVVYVKHPALGTFAIEIDGAVAQLVDSVAAESEFGARAVVSGLANSQHTMRVYPVVGVVAIDAFGVEALPEVTATPTLTPSNEPSEEVTPTNVPSEQPTQTPIASSTPLPLVLPFVETFDSGLGWLPTGVWLFDTQTALSGGGWFAESLTRGLSSTLTFEGQIDLRTALNPELVYWHKMALAEVDFFAVDVSLDGGLTWQVLDLQPGQPGDWTQRKVDLTAYRGQVITLRFRLDTLTLETNANVFTTGVWVDELVIQEAQLTPTPTQVITDVPTVPPTDVPSSTPVPTDIPTDVPTVPPTDVPTETLLPTDTPTDIPTAVPTAVPTDVPTEAPIEPPVEGTEEPAS